MQIIGSLPELIRNDVGLYEGNLIPYFSILFTHPRNLWSGYHNFRHMTHVPWLCSLACKFYAETLTKREMRDLLIAALFHDFDHTGRAGKDDINIALAIRGLRRHVLPEDKEHLEDIENLIVVTEYPYKVLSSGLSLSAQIIRDADLCQAFSVAWLQEVIFGLAREWNKKPVEVLQMQEPFLRALKFNTDWARETFPQQDIEAKIAEARALIELVNGAPPTTS